MKAIALVSGGLDSILAAKVVKEQGIEVIPLRFKIPFCHKAKKQDSGKKPFADLVQEALGSGLKEEEAGDEFFNLLKSPRYGFGSNLNPCIDCKIFMLKKTKILLSDLGASFVVTGEVLGQRPMSQHRQALSAIEKRSGLEGLLLRPLCAKRLAETIPEKRGWVKRQNLYGFNGRRRTPQFELADKFGINDYAQPSGGCLLTDKQFSARLRDLMEHEGLTSESADLLKHGRHFRLSDNSKLIVGRNEEENSLLERFANGKDLIFKPEPSVAGPTALGRGEFNEDLVKLSCRITARYCDLGNSLTAKIMHKGSLYEVMPLQDKELAGLRV